MRKYKFLLKPLFYIFNLLVATWLVLLIEQSRPSDFGKYQYFLKGERPPAVIIDNNKQYLKGLFRGYRTGKIDSVQLERELARFFAWPGKQR